MSKANKHIFWWVILMPLDSQLVRLLYEITLVGAVPVEKWDSLAMRWDGPCMLDPKNAEEADNSSYHPDDGTTLQKSVSLLQAR